MRRYGHQPILPQYSRARPGTIQSILLLIGLIAGTGLYGASFALFSQVFLLELAIPLLILAMLVIWCLPEARTGPVRVLNWLFFAFFAGMILWPDYLALALPGLPWITVRRLVAVPLLITLLVCISVSPASRRQIGEVLAADRVVTRLFLAFLAIQFATFFLSKDIAVSSNKMVVAQLYWTTIFFVGCYVFKRPGSVERWAAVFCLMLIPLGISGLFEWRKSQVPWGGHIPWFLAVGDESVQRILAGGARAATGKYRVQSTFTTSLGYAEYMAMATPFLLHFGLGSYRFLVRLAALAGLPLLFFMIFLTDSRMGAAGFMLGVILYTGALAAFRWRHDTKSLFGPAITLGYPMILVAFLGATFVIGRLHRMVWGGGEHQASTEAREEQYRQGFQILTRNPFGYGIGRGADTLGYRNGEGVLTIDTYYLLVALEYGVIGFLIYYALLIAAGFSAAKRLYGGGPVDREQMLLMPIAVALTIFIVSKSVFSQESNHPLVFMLIAMVLGLLARDRASLQKSG
jgi:hypothetical protein